MKQITNTKMVAFSSPSKFHFLLSKNLFCVFFRNDFFLFLVILILQMIAIPYLSCGNIDGKNLCWTLAYRFIQSVHYSSVEDPKNVLRIQIKIYYVLQSRASSFFLKGPARVRNQSSFAVLRLLRKFRQCRWNTCLEPTLKTSLLEINQI